MKFNDFQLGFAENLALFFYTMALISCISFFLYYKRDGEKVYLFTYMAIGAVVFELCVLLKSMTLDLGFAFGLFAVFSLIRFRTNQVPARELTYLLVSVGIAALDGLTTNEPFIETLLWDAALVVIILFAELFISNLRNKIKTINYEKIELFEEDRYDELVNDLEKRLAIKNITKIKIQEVNFKRSTAKIQVFYKSDKRKSSIIEV